ncbi:MAG: hypothetical protein AAGJ35_09905 [Myxococcota bacterium]
MEDLLDSAQIYQPMAWTAEQSYAFLCSVLDLEEAGVALRILD